MVEPEPPGALFFCLEPEPTQIGQSRSRLLDLGLPEPPNKVAAPQHYLTPHPPFWISTKTSMFESGICMSSCHFNRSFNMIFVVIRMIVLVCCLIQLTFLVDLKKKKIFGPGFESDRVLTAYAEGWQGYYSTYCTN